MVDGAKILLIDDDFEWCAELKEALENERFEVEISHDGLEGINCIKKTPFHLVLLDLKMPKLNGFEVLERIKTISPQTKVIVITASFIGRKDSQLNPLASEFVSFSHETASLADEIVSKPFNVENLLDKIKNLV
jgi:DNA-binding response OmpR family regulator